MSTFRPLNHLVSLHVSVSLFSFCLNSYGAAFPLFVFSPHMAPSDVTLCGHSQRCRLYLCLALDLFRAYW